MPRIEVRHLDDLANQTVGKTQIGELVRRLVYATLAKSQPNLHFLSGETNGYAGWDGWVEISYDDAGTVRRHRSIWELSTDRDFEAKFKRDYKAASDKTLPNGWEKSDVIYVGLTLRSATPKKLAAIKKALIGKRACACAWAGVVLLSAGDIVQWLEKIPSVEDWATDEFKIGPGRFGKSLEHWFEAWAKQTTPHVTEELLKSGRDLSPLTAAFRAESSPFTTLQCDSVEEAVALVYCAAKALPEADSRLVMASSLVVTDEALADRLANQPISSYSMPTAILSPPATRHRNRLSQAGYRVVQALGRLDDSSSVIQFERASVHDFANALETSMGVPAADSEIDARSVGSSVSIWHIRNLLSHAAQPGLPEWVECTQIDVIVAAIFAGAWREDSTPDMEVMEQLAGMGEEQIASALLPYASCVAPLLELIGTNRLVVAPTAAFEFIRRRITTHHIRRLSDAYTTVFGAVSPAVEERWRGETGGMASRNPRAELSDGLRDGLAETLLRIAVLGSQLVSTGALRGYATAQGYVDQLIRSLPGLSRDPRLLASLDRQLPVLIEAAPSPFLEALDALVQGAPDDLSLMLADEPGIFGRSFHTGLLWGLEALAWSDEYLPQVAHLLATLDRIDRGGQLSNRPLRSLCEIFLPWHPGTSASPRSRAVVLRAVVDREPEVGWRLLLELLPGKRQSSVPTHRPKWRSLGQVDRRNVLRSEVMEAYELNIELTLQVAATDAARLSDLVEHYPNLPPRHQATLEAALRATSHNGAEAEVMQRLWARLHKLCRHHSRFADTDWAMSRSHLDRLQAIADTMVAEDPVLKHRWLFDEQFPDLGNRDEAHEERARELQDRRQTALREVLAAKGWNGILQLASTVVYRYIVGTEVGLLNCDDSEVLAAMDAWRLLPSPDWMALRSASSSRLSVAGRDWTNNLLRFTREHSWPALAVAMALVDFPDVRQTYDTIEHLDEDVQREYWGRRFGFVRGATEDLDAFRHAVEGFLAHGRAVDLIDQNWGDLPKLGSAKVLRIIDAFIETPPNKEKAQSLASIEHDLKHLFDWLRKQSDVEVEALARREYTLLPLLTGHGTGSNDLSLHQLLRRQPAFFADVVCDLYKPASAEREVADQDLETVKMRAHAAFELLESWQSPPGVDAGTVDAVEVEAWVAAARELLRTRDRADVGDQRIGKLLYYLPRDPLDGAYPPQPLRKLLEDWRSDQLERGIELESFNSRGVTSRAVLEGGRQERELAERWRRDASTIGAAWPRSRSLCTRIAEMWSRQADSEDLDARHDRAQQSR